MLVNLLTVPNWFGLFNYKLCYLLSLFWSIILLFFIAQAGYCITPTITSLSCSTDSGEASPTWPRNVFTETCNITINRDGETNLKIGVFTNDYVTTKGSGHGSTIYYDVGADPHSPEHRFKTNESSNITTSNTGGSVAIVKSGINTDGDATFTFYLKYTTYEADYGQTTYSQPFIVAVYRDNNAATDTMSDSMEFAIVNKAYISSSGGPVIGLANSQAVFSNGSYYENTQNRTVTVKSNNSWRLYAKILDSLPSDGVQSIPTYFHCSGSGFLNKTSPPPPNSNRTEFTAYNTNYQAAENNTGEYRTGTTDYINLDGVGVIFTYALKTTGTAYNKGTFNSNLRYTLSYP